MSRFHFRWLGIFLRGANVSLANLLFISVIVVRQARALDRPGYSGDYFPAISKIQFKDLDRAMVRDTAPPLFRPVQIELI
jgi:hypothetical protein